MIVNPGKFQATIVDKKKNIHTQEIIELDKKKCVKVKLSVKPLVVQIDANLHIVNICRSAGTQPMLLLV